MNLKKVVSLQTTDGTLFTDKEKAIFHQSMLDIRGVIQSNNLGKLQAMGVTDVAMFIVAHAPELTKILSDRNRSLTSLKKGAKNG
jgi:hypothetical protein